MSPEVEFRHEGIVLDACCMINLCVSGQMEAILSTLTIKVALASYVAEKEIKQCNLQPLIQGNLLSLVSVETEEEANNVLTFVQRLGGDGEAYTGAAALRLGWAMASDENRVLNYYRERMPHIQCLTTPELVKYWADHAHPSEQMIQQALSAITEEGNYTIGKRHSCYDWWTAHISVKN